VGALRAHKVSYFTMQDGHLISVPDFPAWVCDVCGAREYDAAAVAELRAMLETNRSMLRRPRRPRLKGDTDSTRPAAAPRRRP
jgi:YgiT-type zinc finger domain-containing protein